MKQSPLLELALPSDGKFCIDLVDGEDGLRAHVTVLDCYDNQIPYKMWMNAKNFAFDWENPEDFVYVTMPEVAAISRLMGLAFRWSIAEGLITSEDDLENEEE